MRGIVKALTRDLGAPQTLEFKLCSIADEQKTASVVRFAHGLIGRREVDHFRRPRDGRDRPTGVER